MGMLNSRVIQHLNSHIIQVSFPEFIDGHYYTPPDRQKSPPIVSFSDSESLPEPVPPTSQRKRVWALQDHPYLPFILNSPFHGVISSRLATPPVQIHIDGDSYGFHIEAWSALSKSLDTLVILFPSSLHFVGVLTTPTKLLRRPRQGPDGGKPCLTDRTTFIPNSYNSWSIFPIAHFTTGPQRVNVYGLFRTIHTSPLY